MREYRALPRFLGALAHLYAELGRERDARAALNELLSISAANTWTRTGSSALSLLPHVCAYLEDRGAARRLTAGPSSPRPAEVCYP